MVAPGMASVASMAATASSGALGLDTRFTLVTIEKNSARTWEVKHSVSSPLGPLKQGAASVCLQNMTLNY